ncbi:hypothetical protein EXW35_11910 [Bacillus mycoides]|uniref:hypothetical protein n=1 Tax=Bacillus mycoides TaxID=1405 RepID=UPI001C009CBA|nr:hypothetical protein [Bacillus mycoides]QWG39113.1 hypothetical protein EXW35_11910 [Bacillus mycoides]
MDENLDHQQRRMMEREQKKTRERQSFHRGEVQQVSLLSYKDGRTLALQAVKEVLGLGPVRLERVQKRLEELENENFNALFLEHLRK